MDFVPNHSSDECEWFKLSLKRVDPFTNFYIWKDGVPINATHTTNPNNWVVLSFFLDVGIDANLVYSRKEQAIYIHITKIRTYTQRNVIE